MSSQIIPIASQYVADMHAFSSSLLQFSSKKEEVLEVKDSGNNTSTQGKHCFEVEGHKTRAYQLFQTTQALFQKQELHQHRQSLTHIGAYLRQIATILEMKDIPDEKRIRYFKEVHVDITAATAKILQSKSVVSVTPSTSPIKAKENTPLSPFLYNTISVTATTLIDTFSQYVITGQEIEDKLCLQYLVACYSFANLLETGLVKEHLHALYQEFSKLYHTPKNERKLTDLLRTLTSLKKCLKTTQPQRSFDLNEAKKNTHPYIVRDNFLSA